jgi:hypothetical protein
MSYTKISTLTANRLRASSQPTFYPPTRPSLQFRLRWLKQFFPRKQKLLLVEPEDYRAMLLHSAALLQITPGRGLPFG